MTSTLFKLKGSGLCWVWRACLCASLWVFSLSSAQGQDDFMTLDEIVDAAQEWVEENVDEDVLAALQSGDKEKIRRLFDQLQKEFKGDCVLDLAALKDTARALLPVLEQYEETAGYAVWLKTRLDYLEVSERLRSLVPPPKVEPGQPAKRLPNPTPQLEREVWVRTLAERPWPENAKAYVTRLKPVFAAQNVPPELVWVAEVESSFNPKARSPVGAAGLFQLMPATAKRFGLHRWPVDQRLKPEESATAAAKYLQFLYGRFKDWRLALAAYNAGEGTVQRLLDRYKTQSFDAIAPKLPAETQMYVPRVEATLLRREGLKLTQLQSP